MMDATKSWEPMVPQVIRIFNSDGSPRGSATSANSVYSSPAIADLNGDGILEIVVGTSDGTILVLKGDGTSFSDWPVVLPGRPQPMMPRNDVDSLLVIGDLDGDGHPDIAVLSDEGILYAYNKDGQPLSGFPFLSPSQTYVQPVPVSANSLPPWWRIWMGIAISMSWRRCPTPVCMPSTGMGRRLTGSPSSCRQEQMPTQLLSWVMTSSRLLPWEMWTGMACWNSRWPSAQWIG